MMLFSRTWMLVVTVGLLITMSHRVHGTTTEGWNW
jgi:hypothetical protein